MFVEWTTRTLVCSLCFLLYVPFAFAQDNAIAPSQQENTNTKQPPSSDVTALPEMTVAAPLVDEKAYNVPNTTTATRTDTPIMETPFSVQVVPQQVLKDQQVVRVQKALENVSGVYQQSTGIGDVAFFSLRGFGSYDGSNSFVYRDGVHGDFAAGQSFPDLANIERIGRLRGLKFGAGVVLRGQQEANNENTVHLPGYTLVNLMVSYEWRVGSSTLTAQLNVDNLFDKKFFSAGGFGGGAFAGAPRMALGSLRWEW
jgi:iron complex outermembrane receptor protein